ncbi:DUF7336 domain-containing protein [Pedosphaera parvula]|uniref:Homoserine kinase n=1 Tax=Pedosphaera parvula (strain Ellin514) TaxID=320771 RepID=B9XG60_PEDPL|nr:hypothetical protein [Pedosphaera parvula]EEF61222.1 homoserine kinase [Pedosphaera parvula Ellin514]
MNSQSTNTVFVVQHLHSLLGGNEDIKLIGIYRSAKSAQAAVERLKIQPGFRDYPRLINPDIDEDEQGFYIDEYTLDSDHWPLGFVTI